MSDKIVVATSTFTRPSTEVPFRKEFPDMAKDVFRSFIKQAYIDTGKILSRTESVSEDQLTLTVVTVWINNAERENYINNFIIKRHFEHTINYCHEAGIIFNWKNEEYDGDTIAREWSGTF